MQRGDDELGYRTEVTGRHRAQHLVGAHNIIESLQRSNRQRVRVADLQIRTTGRIVAFQVKWSCYRGSVTLRDLARGGASDPCLVDQLAYGGVGGGPPVQRLRDYD